MTSIQPFIGIRYNNEVVINPASVLAPPYDAIDDKMQARCYAESPFNVVRLEKAMHFPTDTADNNSYTRSARYLNHWMENGTLVADSSPRYYIYEQQPAAASKGHLFLIGSLSAEEYGRKVIPHKETTEARKADRLRLLSATGCQFSPVFGLYSDPARTVETLLRGSIQGKEPVSSFSDSRGCHHRLWSVEDEKSRDLIGRHLADKEVYLADGHHRFEAGLEYAGEITADAGKQPFPIVIALANMFDDGLQVLPRHRVVTTSLDLDPFMKRLSRYFTLEEMNPEARNTVESWLPKAGEKGAMAFALYTGDSLFKAVLNDRQEIHSLLPEDTPESIKGLDMSIMDHAVIGRLLPGGSRKVPPTRTTLEVREAFGQVEDGKARAAFILNPPTVSQVVMVARTGGRLPADSTSFSPFIPAGIIMHKT